MMNKQNNISGKSLIVLAIAGTVLIAAHDAVKAYAPEKIDLYMQYLAEITITS